MKRIIVAGLILGCLISCRKTPDTSQLTNKFVVTTVRDPNANFASYKKYAISDTVAYISNTPSTDSIIVGAIATSLVNAVKTNMNARGYTLVPRTQQFDLGMKITVIKQVNAGVVYPPGWWWGYPGYPGGCYWGCYPPYYPMPPVAYKYSVGDFITETFDVKNAETNNNLQSIWYMQLSGVLSSTDATNVTRTTDGIDQAFKQSPYFKK